MYPPRFLLIVTYDLSRRFSKTLEGGGGKGGMGRGEGGEGGMGRGEGGDGGEGGGRGRGGRGAILLFTLLQGTRLDYFMCS